MIAPYTADKRSTRRFRAIILTLHSNDEHVSGLLRYTLRRWSIDRVRAGYSHQGAIRRRASVNLTGFFPFGSRLKSQNMLIPKRKEQNLIKRLSLDTSNNSNSEGFKGTIFAVFEL